MAHALAAAVPHVPPADGRISVVGAMPLSRLPEVPSMYAPSIRTSPKPPPANAPTVSVPSAAAVPLIVGAGMGPMSELGATMPAERVPAMTPVPMAPGGTLASPAAHPVVDPSIHVALAPSVDETLASNDQPAIGRQVRIIRGVPPLVVVFLVVGALVAGLLLGWAAARMS
jgi:hypothetical protein